MTGYCAACPHHQQVHAATDGSLCRGLCGDRHDPASHTGPCTANCRCEGFQSSRRDQ